MSRPIIFGDISGIAEGQWFEGRKEMMSTSFHRQWGAGIDGNGKVGTAAIVLSGGYEDDEDTGDEIVYTGAGGSDVKSGKQIKDQIWKTAGNAGLLKSMDEGLPIRVIRGYSHKSPFSPKKGYLYAGLFSVVEAWEAVGKSGYKICRFRLVYSGRNWEHKIPEATELDYTRREREVKETTILRIIRDTKISREIKKIYHHQCQVCGLAIKTKSGFYAEGAHIRPLGRPHNGEDNPNNLICLCPNHHILFDKGCFSIMDDLTLIGDISGKLRLDKKHKLDFLNLMYHRKSHGYD